MLRTVVRGAGRFVLLFPAALSGLLILAFAATAEAQQWIADAWITDESTTDSGVDRPALFDPPADQLLAGGAVEAEWDLASLAEAVPLHYQEPQANQDGPADTVKEPTEPLGQAPEDTSLLFLRRATVLLEPGQIDLDSGLRYTWQEIQRPAIVGTLRVVDTERYRLRQFIVPWAVRYGLARRTQAFVNLPVGAALAELANPTADDFTSDGGFGDISAGLTYQFRRQQGRCPDIIGSVYFTAPTGQHPFQQVPVHPLLHDPNVAVLGSGFWNISANLGFVRSYDPAVVFGQLGYGHQFGRSFVGSHYQPGEVFTYQFGLGFAINDRLTLSSVFQGGLQTTWIVDDRHAPGSSIEPFGLRFALTAAVSRSYILEPFLALGLNEDAAAADFGVICTRRF